MTHLIIGRYGLTHVVPSEGHFMPSFRFAEFHSEPLDFNAERNEMGTRAFSGTFAKARIHSHQARQARCKSRKTEICSKFGREPSALESIGIRYIARGLSCHAPALIVYFYLSGGSVPRAKQTRPLISDT
jgi:hypothetical protein